MKRSLFFITAALILASCSGEEPVHDARMDRSKLNIGTYFLQPYARTEKHVADLKECGIDFVVGMPVEKEILDLFSKYEVGAVVSGACPGWWGGDGANAGMLSQVNPISVYEDAAKKFEDHPAIWGIDIGDEPSALDFPYYGQVYPRVQELFPNQFPYLNLYPNYASVAENTGEQTVNQLGTRTYAEHISEYCRNISSDYISYDYYMYAANIPYAYRNLSVVADACRASGRSMWIILQVNSNKPEEWITTNELRYQAYTAMAFGAEVITWGCYTAGWWHNQVLDDKGEKTQQYDKLKMVNTELHAIGVPYMKYRRVNTSFVGFAGTEWLGDSDIPSVEAYSDDVFTGLKTSDNSPIVVGSMVSRDGKGHKALFVCAADDPYDSDHKTQTLTFSTEGFDSLYVTGTDGSTLEVAPSDGLYSVKIESCSAVLIETK